MQRPQSLRRASLLAVGLCVLAGTSNAINAQSESQLRHSGSPIAESAQGRKPGDALPPKDRSVGDKWAPEIRQFIDQMLLTFDRSRPGPLTDAEIEKAFGAVLTARPDLWRGEGVEEIFQLTGAPYFTPSEAHVAYATYTKGTGWDTKRGGWRGRRYGAFEASINIGKYCVDPYDFAIYTGSRFRPEPELHESTKPAGYHRPRYEWGMFEIARLRTYRSDIGVRVVLRERCVASFRMSATLAEASKP